MHAITLRRFPIGTRCGSPAPFSDRNTARYPAEIRRQRTSGMPDMRPPCAVFRSENVAVTRRDPEATHMNYVRHGPSCAVFGSENGAVSRRDPEATHVRYARHATTLRRVPIGKRHGNPQRSRGIAYKLCETWPILRRFPIGKRRGNPQRSGGNARQVRQTCDHRAPFSGRTTAR
jgi:hypothetical protein